MIKIKICGIKTLDEVNDLNILKPDYAGFVFTKSKREIDINDAQKIIPKLDREIKRVGVFRNNSAHYIISISKKVNLDAIQLHGDEDLNFIKYLREKINKNTLIWKAFSIERLSYIKTFINDALFKNVNEIIIDGAQPGSGYAYNMDNLIKASDYIKKKTDFFLSGGLNPENAAERIQKVCPEGIDVSSGVEGENYIKSYDKMKKLIDNVRALN